MSEESVYKICMVAFAVAAVLLGLSVFIAAIQLGSAIVSGVMLVIFQILLTVATIVLVLAVAGSLASAACSGIVKRMSALERAHGEFLYQLNKRAPTFAASAVLLATLVLLLADKSFKGDTVPTLCVGVVLTLLFWIANELLVAESRLRKSLGAALWIAALVFLPAAACLYHAGNLEAMLQGVANMGMPALSLLGLSFLVACFAPIALKE